ncbi:MAG TPA: AzlD domain-containing protein [Firmicutes bacterium]|jgi:branched-subunit amino acid transport protein|nr:AzlD domain-containing protein [Bacillota bacterium]
MIIWLVILGMLAVTYIPRLVPLITITDNTLPPFCRRFLQFIPYTALGALIIPGVVNATPGKPIAALAGLGTAVLCAWFKAGVILSIFAAIMVTFLMLCVLT